MASIKHLDNPLLLLILNRLSVQKLFTAGHVCVRWNAMRDMSLSERKELTLLIGSEAQRCIDDSGLEIFQRRLLVDEYGDVMFPEKDQIDAHLKIHSFPLEFSLFLWAHFDHLTTLTISTRLTFQEFSSITHLLKQFNRPNGTLHTLKVYANCFRNLLSTENKRKFPYIQLLSAINSIISLRKLVFDEIVMYGRHSKTFRTDLPILAQLEEFDFNSGDRFVSLIDSITRYAVNNQGLKRIGIHTPASDIALLLDIPTELSFRFTHLHFHYIYKDFEGYYERLCGHFSHLTSLEITFRQDKFTIFKLFRPLTQLTNLLSLGINCGGPTVNRSSVPPNERGIMHFELPSVKVFTITLIYTHSTVGHNFFHKCNLNRLFPNVQVVQVIREDSLCYYCNKKIAGWEDSDVIDDEEIEAQEEHCARHMFRHFDHCRHLKMVCSKVGGLNVRFYGIACRQWIWSEMEPFEEEEEE